MNQRTIKAPRIGSVKGTNANIIARIPAKILRPRDHPGSSREKSPLIRELIPRKSNPIPKMRMIPYKAAIVGSAISQMAIPMAKIPRISSSIRNHIGVF